MELLLLLCRGGQHSKLGGWGVLGDSVFICRTMAAVAGGRWEWAGLARAWGLAWGGMSGLQETWEGSAAFLPVSGDGGQSQ